MHAGHDRHTKIDLHTTEVKTKPTVLGQAAFRDVELRQNLDARNDFLRLLQTGQARKARHHTIQPVFCRNPCAVALEVHVTGAGLKSSVQGLVNERDDGASGTDPVVRHAWLL